GIKNKNSLDDTEVCIRCNCAKLLVDFILKGDQTIAKIRAAAYFRPKKK
ncbi:26568_t:CDS:1, partial [Gigaspora margarita]